LLPKRGECVGVEVEFKKLSEVSLSKIVDLVNSIFKDYVVPIKWDMLSFELDMKENSISLEDSYLMRIEGEDIGFCINALRPPYARIDAFGIRRPYRRRRLGDALLNYSLDSLKWKGVKEISLEVAEHDEAVIFYEKNGFRIERTLISYYVDEKVDAEPLNFTDAVIDEIYNEAVINQKEKLRFPNWQREPLTLKLSEDRYNHNFLKDGNKEVGYVVWGTNPDGAYIIDAAPKDFKNYNGFFKRLIASIQTSLSIEKMIIMNVPENDSLTGAVIAAGMKPFFKQWEMVKV